MEKVRRVVIVQQLYIAIQHSQAQFSKLNYIFILVVSIKSRMRSELGMQSLFRIHTEADLGSHWRNGVSCKEWLNQPESSTHICTRIRTCTHKHRHTHTHTHTHATHTGTCTHTFVFDYCLFGEYPTAGNKKKSGHSKHLLVSCIQTNSSLPFSW